MIFTDVSNGGGGSILMTFTDAAFANTTVSVASSSFTGLSVTRSGNTISVSVPTFSAAGTYSATINISPAGAVPEPASAAMLGGAGLAGLAFARARRRRVA